MVKLYTYPHERLVRNRLSYGVADHEVSDTVLPGIEWVLS
jgi:hypothetical protein